MSSSGESGVRRSHGDVVGHSRDGSGTPRLAGVDAARGLALIGLIAVHILPEEDEATGEPTWSFLLFSGDSAALFALLAGAGLAIAAQFTSWMLLYAAGGFQRLVASSPGLDEEAVMEALTWGPDTDGPASPWWLAVTAQHMNTPLSIAWSLGVGMTVLGVFLLAARWIQAWLRPLAAMGAMTLTLYSAHLVALSVELHEDEPYLWFTAHVVTAALFALTWQALVGQGPLEKVVGTAAQASRRAVLRGAPTRRT
jgi:hypothetical protein